MTRAAFAAAMLLGAGPALAQAPTAPPVVAPALIGPALFVSDIAHSLRFYVDGLGMKVSLQMGPPERRETILTFGGDPSSAGIILLADTRATAPAPVVLAHGYDRSVLRMPNLDGVAARLKSAGFAPGSIRDVAMGYRMMLAVDPDGYRYEIVERNAATKAAP